MPARFLSRSSIWARFVVAPVLALLILGIMAPASAAESAIAVTDAWARAPLLPGRPAAAYFVIENGGSADRLVEVRSDAAGRTEIHNHVHEDGVMKMRKLDGVDIPAAGKVTFEPRGYHVMLFEPRSELREGAEIPVTLVFEHAGEITVTAPVRGMKAKPDMGGDGDH